MAQKSEASSEKKIAHYLFFFSFLQIPYGLIFY